MVEHVHLVQSVQVQFPKNLQFQSLDALLHDLVPELDFDLYQLHHLPSQQLEVGLILKGVLEGGLPHVP